MPARKEGESKKIKEMESCGSPLCCALFSKTAIFGGMTKAVIHKDCEKPSFKTKCMVEQSDGILQSRRTIIHP